MTLCVSSEGLAELPFEIASAPPWAVLLAMLPAALKQSQAVKASTNEEPPNRPLWWRLNGTTTLLTCHANVIA